MKIPLIITLCVVYSPIEAENRTAEYELVSKYSTENYLSSRFDKNTIDYQRIDEPLSRIKRDKKYKSKNKELYERRQRKFSVKAKIRKSLLRKGYFTTVKYTHRVMKKYVRGVGKVTIKSRYAATESKRRKPQPKFQVHPGGVRKDENQQIGDMAFAERLAKRIKKEQGKNIFVKPFLDEKNRKKLQDEKAQFRAQVKDHPYDPHKELQNRFKGERAKFQQERDRRTKERRKFHSSESFETQEEPKRYDARRQRTRTFNTESRVTGDWKSYTWDRNRTTGWKTYSLTEEFEESTYKARHPKHKTSISLREFEKSETDYYDKADSQEKFGSEYMAARKQYDHLLDSDYKIHKISKHPRPVTSSWEYESADKSQKGSKSYRSSEDSEDYESYENSGDQSYKGSEYDESRKGSEHDESHQYSEHDESYKGSKSYESYEASKTDQSYEASKTDQSYEASEHEESSKYEDYESGGYESTGDEIEHDSQEINATKSSNSSEDLAKYDANYKSMYESDSQVLRRPSYEVFRYDDDEEETSQQRRKRLSKEKRRKKILRARRRTDTTLLPRKTLFTTTTRKVTKKTPLPIRSKLYPFSTHNVPTLPGNLPLLAMNDSEEWLQSMFGRAQTHDLLKLLRDNNTDRWYKDYSYYDQRLNRSDQLPPAVTFSSLEDTSQESLPKPISPASSIKTSRSKISQTKASPEHSTLIESSHTRRVKSTSEVSTKTHEISTSSQTTVHSDVKTSQKRGRKLKTTLPSETESTKRNQSESTRITSEEPSHRVVSQKHTRKLKTTQSSGSDTTSKSELTQSETSTNLEKTSHSTGSELTLSHSRVEETSKKHTRKQKTTQSSGSDTKSSQQITQTEASTSPAKTSHSTGSELTSSHSRVEETSKKRTRKPKTTHSSGSDIKSSQQITQTEASTSPAKTSHSTQSGVEETSQKHTRKKKLRQSENNIK